MNGSANGGESTGGASRPAAMEINDPATIAEVSAQLARYEEALTGNDVAVLDELF